ncbi:phosphonoacetaldehyde hydrolase [Oleiphilus messinensis]|uniref:Phosphonoacetaldehyde hydrolase n=1 Tax=Oleiphilus messinensis TaxID=141451 RepID=A0A1Y0ICM5_9GAMM|nr:phosphonoacetaldehyde hydrolase [Oleiphilus messinensis]ARU58010.1 phosphonoacetaldehyde hydrolase [Oleiphilus messinensis]
MFHYQRKYSGAIQAVIFDWAGTTVDFGSMAPIQAFKMLFAKEGITVSDTQARAPMGTEKREHIRQMLAMEAIRKAWLESKGTAPTEQCIDRLYHEFVPIQIEAIRTTTQLIPGLVDTLNDLKARSIHIGANTGYNTEMYQAVAAAAAELGYQPEANVCATEVSLGRPYPYMAQAVMQKLGVVAVQSCIKVDDTTTGIEEGLNAGMWTVAVALTGNYLGYGPEEWAALDESERQPLIESARLAASRSGAHFVIDSVAELPAVIDKIEQRLSQGMHP